jgi:hypothetical protein
MKWIFQIRNYKIMVESMKINLKYLILIFIVFLQSMFINCKKNENYITVNNFQIIKNFILKKGNRFTYCSKYNKNPYYRFKALDVFLNPEPGGPYNHPQWNLNCDPALSDFDEILIRDSEMNYYHFKLDKIHNNIRLIIYSNNNPVIVTDPDNLGYKYFIEIFEYIKQHE